MESVCERVEKEMMKERIDVVGPNVAYLIQINDKIEEIKNQKIGLGLDKLDWVFYPVSDKENPEEGDGGNHWSLLLYSKKENKFFHLDPKKGLNEKHAKKLHLRLLDSNSYDKYGNLPPLREVDCKEQPNGYDCGIYIIMYTLQILRNIKERRNAVDVRDIPYKAKEMREQLKYACEVKISQRRFKRKEENLIDILEDLMKKKEIMEKEKAEKAKKEKSIREKNPFKSNRDTVYQKSTEDKGKNEKRKDRALDIEECRYYRLGKCKYDNNCRYTHKKDNTKEETEKKREKRTAS